MKGCEVDGNLGCGRWGMGERKGHLEMRRLMDAIAFGFEEDKLDVAMVLLLCSEMVRYQCTGRFSGMKVSRS